MISERQKEILEILYQKGRVSVAELSKTLYVTEMTVRRDLTEMEKGGFLRRYRGGAVLKINLGEMPITERLLLDKDEKEELAKKALPYINKAAPKISKKKRTTFWSCSIINLKLLPVDS